MVFPLLLVLAAAGPDANPAADRLADAPAVAAKIDEFTAKYWHDGELKPADPVGDAEYLRRLTLDLAGRIPTYREATAFAADRSPDKRARAVRRLMESPEYPLHMGRVLDDMIQGKYAGDAEFLEYLRSSVSAHKGWDQLFRDMLLGPWEAKEQKAANRFLVKRLNSLDDLTNDTARVFFGVNVSCAKCHDHPLVSDWKQDHYYGMASFFNRTYEGSKGKNGAVKENPTGDVSFDTRSGKKKTAKLMFLSGAVVDESAAAAGRRERLVQIALEDKTYFRRAIVNRMWGYFLGRGLVQPVDQMHSANPPEIPDLLEYLGDDFAGHGYDLDRLTAALVSSRVYQLASGRPAAAAEGGDGLFARAVLRPLTPHQYALSMTLAAGDGSFDRDADPAARVQRRRDLESRIAGILKVDLLDPRSDRFQSSAAEALFLSNNPEVQKLTAPSGDNLTARLAALADDGQAVELAVWTVLSRPPRAEEKTYLVQWLQDRKQERAKACGDLVWALMTSAEFRFIH